MPACCRCNASGSCRGYSCVKNREICSSCLPLRRGHCCNTGLNDRHSATSIDHAESTVTVNEPPPTTSPADPTPILIANRDAANLEVEETTGSCTASLQNQLGASDGVSGCSVEIGEEHPLVYHNHIPIILALPAHLTLDGGIEMGTASQRSWTKFMKRQCIGGQMFLKSREGRLDRPLSKKCLV